MGQHRLLDRRRETLAVDSEGAASRHLMGVGAAHDDRPKRAHLAMEHADRVGRRVVGAKRVGADEFGEPARPVGGGRGPRAHFVQHDGNAGFRRLPRRLRSGEAAADHVNGTHGVSWPSLQKKRQLRGRETTKSSGSGGAVFGRPLEAARYRWTWRAYAATRSSD